MFDLMPHQERQTAHRELDIIQVAAIVTIAVEVRRIPCALTPDIEWLIFLLPSTSFKCILEVRVHWLRKRSCVRPFNDGGERRLARA